MRSPSRPPALEHKEAAFRPQPLICITWI